MLSLDDADKKLGVMYILDDAGHDYFGFKYFVARDDARFNFE